MQIGCSAIAALPRPPSARGPAGSVVPMQQQAPLHPGGRTWHPWSGLRAADPRRRGVPADRRTPPAAARTSVGSLLGRRSGR